MNSGVGAAQIGQWYANLDTAEVFFVTGYDPHSRTIETQSIDGDVSEIDEEAWGALPLALTDQPEVEAEDTDHDTLDEGYVDDLNSPLARIASRSGE